MFLAKKWWKYEAPTVLTLIKRRCAHSRIVVYLPTILLQSSTYTLTHTQTVSVYLHAVKRQPTVQCNSSSSRRLCERGHCRLHTNVLFGLTSCANFYNDHFLVLLFCSHNISLFFFPCCLCHFCWFRNSFVWSTYQRCNKIPLFCLDRVKLGH